jgi:hypothetical protein
MRSIIEVKPPRSVNRRRPKYLSDFKYSCVINFDYLGNLVEKETLFLKEHKNTTVLTY